MLSKEIKEKIMRDLNIREHTARTIAEAFLKKYPGLKCAIQNVEASFTDEGTLRITYFINGKPKSIVLTRKQITESSKPKQ